MKPQAKKPDAEQQRNSEEHIELLSVKAELHPHLNTQINPFTTQFITKLTTKPLNDITTQCQIFLDKSLYRTPFLYLYALFLFVKRPDKHKQIRKSCFGVITYFLLYKQQFPSIYPTIPYVMSFILQRFLPISVSITSLTS